MAGLLFWSIGGQSLELTRSTEWHQLRDESARRLARTDDSEDFDLSEIA